MSNAARPPDPTRQRHFAEEVVRRLRGAGYQALWAGGCVRDMLLGTQPVDFDVATDAVPEQIREVFGRRRTIAVGAAFGVITVLGPRDAGQIEVATFRRDLGYSDGRHPDAVAFSSPEEDARRRDFTINGMFFDPIKQEVIDFVDGRADLERGLIRAIGVPRERFTEDRLRLLRAVRFAARLGFALETETQSAIAEMAGQIGGVSPERVGQEMRKLLTAEHRVAGVRLLIETRLAEPVFPELLCSGLSAKHAERRLAEGLTLLERVERPRFILALAALLLPLAATGEAVADLADRWRLSAKEAAGVQWLLASVATIEESQSRRFSELQPLLIHAEAEQLIRLAEAHRPGSDDVAYALAQSARPREELDPPPLLTGRDLIDRGIPPGPRMGELLTEVRRAQLDGEIADREEAWARIE